MGQVCGKVKRPKNPLKKQQYIIEDRKQASNSKSGSKDRFEYGEVKFCIKRQVTYNDNLPELISEKQQRLKLLNQQERYEELQNNLVDDKINSKENLQIILNIYLYCNFKRKEINLCLDQIKTNLDYKENLKLIGIYRESSLKYHKTEICLLCYQENIECYSLSCQHIFCKDCWDQMIEIQLSNYIPIVKCLQNQCQERLPHQYLELNQSYKEILLKRMLENSPSYTWCPGIDCKNVYSVQKISYRYKCNCGIKFCSNCKIESHYPITCQIFQKITEFKEPQQSWTKLDIYQCPNCKLYIQKDQGCIQIQCVCGNAFCTKCSQLWNKEHGKDFYKCPFQDFNKNPSDLFIQMCQKESSITKIISELDYYDKLLKQQFKNNQDNIVNNNEQINKNEEIFKYRKILKNLKTFIKFEKIAIYFTYYLNEYFTENELDYGCQQFSKEINYYYEVLKNQLKGILFVELKIEKNEIIDFKQFKQQAYEMDQNLKIQKKGLQNEIKIFQSNMQENAQ